MVTYPASAFMRVDRSQDSQLVGPSSPWNASLIILRPTAVGFTSANAAVASVSQHCDWHVNPALKSKCSIPLPGVLATCARCSSCLSDIENPHAAVGGHAFLAFMRHHGANTVSSPCRGAVSLLCSSCESNRTRGNGPIADAARGQVPSGGVALVLARRLTSHDHPRCRCSAATGHRNRWRLFRGRRASPALPRWRPAIELRPCPVTARRAAIVSSIATVRSPWADQAAIPIDSASALSLLRPWPVDNNRTRRTSFAGTSVIMIWSSFSRCVSGAPQLAGPSIAHG